MAGRPVRKKPRVFRGRGVGDEGCRQAGLAAPRDAIWYLKPGIARKRHVVAPDGGSECCGMPLILEMSDKKLLVPLWQRCQRPGCREKWPVLSLRRLMRNEKTPVGTTVMVLSACCQATARVNGRTATGYWCDGCGRACVTATYEVTRQGE